MREKGKLKRMAVIQKGAVWRTGTEKFQAQS